MNSIAGVVLAIIILQSGNCSAACLHARKTEGADQAREYIYRKNKNKFQPRQEQVATAPFSRVLQK